MLKIMACFWAMLILLCPTGAQAGKTLTFGMSAAFTGSNSELGIEFYRGMKAYLDHVNKGGGVNGHRLEIKPSNDGYNPRPCFQNTLEFARDAEIFALFGYVGTPTTTVILPLLERFEANRLFLLFPLTGSKPLRETPYEKYVFNLRPSYFAETKALVDNLIDTGHKRIAVFYQADAYGRNGWDGVNRALKAYGRSIVMDVAYRRGATVDTDFKREVALLRDARPDAIITVGTYAACTAFIRDARDSGTNIPIAGLSFADVDKLAAGLDSMSRINGRDYTKNLIFSQVVPSYQDTTLPAVRLYRQLMKSSVSTPPSAASGYKPRRYSFVSFEGFLNAVLLTEIIRRMGDEPERAKLRDTILTINDFDLGINEHVAFSNGNNQGLHTVHFTTISGGAPVIFTDWSRWKR